MKLLALSLSLFLLTGCQMGYLLENGYYQLDLLTSRQPLKEALKDPKLPEETKRKLKLAAEAAEFSEKVLHLKSTDNYTSFVQLPGRYVVHSLTVAKKDELKPYKWSFPFFGEFPYLGYYNKESAKIARDRYKKANYDTYLRGVTAFSSLGWFDDPILSSMLRYSDYDLVNVIIHETVHATIYVKDHVDFNERLATYIGNIGTEIFYKQKEGDNSKTLIETKKASVDDQLFSKFITAELKSLKAWYKEKRKSKFTEEERQSRLKEINERFAKDVLPAMQTQSYKWFAKAELNNARLLSYNTYFKDLSDFEKAYNKLGRDFKKLIEYCLSLEDEKDPEKALKDFTI